MKTLKYMYDNHPVPIPEKKNRCECAECHKKRSISHNGQRSIINKISGQVFQVAKKPTQWHYNGYGYFCSMTCATRFANRVVETKIIKP